MVKELVFAVPGDLAAPTGGYTYDRRIIAELPALGWRRRCSISAKASRGRAAPPARPRQEALRPLAPGRPLVIDGLALGVLPDTVKALQSSYPLVALVHHPLALESGLSSSDAAALQRSERAALACAHRVIVTSAVTARLLAAEYDVSSERLIVVEPGMDRRDIHSRKAAEIVTLLSVGAVIPRKGYDVLIAALAKLKELQWRLVIAGDCTRSPDAARRLEANITDAGLADRVALLGAVGSRRLAALYGSADLFVLASRFEGYGMAYAEAIAHGVPVIGTTAGAIPETVPPGAGVLVPPDDVDALGRALRRLIESADERERLAEGARGIRFPSWHEQAMRFVSVLESLA